MASIVCSSPSIQQYTPQHKMSITQYPDSGLGLDYDSDIEEGEEDKLSAGETKPLHPAECSTGPETKLPSSPFSPEDTNSTVASDATILNVNNSIAFFSHFKFNNHSC